MPKAPKGSKQESCAKTPEEQTLIRIRTLNDHLRQSGQGGRIVITHGVSALGRGAFFQIRYAIAQHTRFTNDNDPHGAHDFGTLAYQNLQILWKIDYYDLEMEYHSIDPANSDITIRVLTIMLASEY
ncbi:MAG: hypothetical protein COA84_01595 [Robiginitomaculum sp.]|nr:MAG: hypothetical protein COA84_01595 [Robiginitomaculum sp.]